MAKHYRIGQFVKVKVTGIQPYGAFVKTPDNREGLIHISEVMDDYVHDVGQFLTKGQIVKAKVLSIEDGNKLNLTLKDNDYFRNEERTTGQRSVLDLIKENEEFGFKSLQQKMPEWIQDAKTKMKHDQI